MQSIYIMVHVRKLISIKNTNHNIIKFKKGKINVKKMKYIN